MKPQTHLILPDVHFPYHDEHLLKAWLNDAEETKPAGVHILGDLLDCYTLSSFDKDPARKGTLQDEVDTAGDFLDKMRGAVGDTCVIRYSEGNHEHRLTRVLWGKAKELATIRRLSIPELLELRGLGVTYHGPQKPYQVGRLRFIHGDVASKRNWSVAPGGTTAAAIVRAKGQSVIMGHTHKMGHVSLQTWERLLEGFECGCLCRLDMDYVVGVPQWQQGWATVDFTRSGYYDVSFVRVCSQKPGSRRTLVYCGEELCTLPPAPIH